MKGKLILPPCVERAFPFFFLVASSVPPSQIQSETGPAGTNAKQTYLFGFLVKGIMLSEPPPHAP